MFTQTDQIDWTGESHFRTGQHHTVLKLAVSMLYFFVPLSSDEQMWKITNAENFCFTCRELSWYVF